MGNKNIVRVSENNNDQVSLLIDLINNEIKKDQYQSIINTFLIVRYGHDDDVTSYFSKLCGMRVIWGGDETKEYKKIVLTLDGAM